MEHTERPFHRPAGPLAPNSRAVAFLDARYMRWLARLDEPDAPGAGLLPMSRDRLNELMQMSLGRALGRMQLLRLYWYTDADDRQVCNDQTLRLVSLDADGAALVRYRALAGDVESVELVLEGLEPQPMGSVVRVGSFDWWQIRITAGSAEKRYAFVVKDGATQWTDPAEFRVPVFSVAVPFHTPDWAKGAVWYQIMVDRFRNGDRANDPEPVRPWTSDWEKPSDFEGKDGQTMWRWFA